MSDDKTAAGDECMWCRYGDHPSGRGCPMHEHIPGYTHDRTASDGNMWTTTPICSCGWAGNAIAAYRDDQWSLIQRQAQQHRSEVESYE